MQARVVQKLVGLMVLMGVLSATVRVQPQAVPAPAMSANQAYIVQAATSENAAAAVVQAGGTIKQSLALVKGVSAELSPLAVAQLQQQPGIALFPDVQVWKSGNPDEKETDTKGYALYPAAATEASAVHEQSIDTPRQDCTAVAANDWRVVRSAGTEQRPLQGWGVTVAVVDSGVMQFNNASTWTRNPSTGELFANDDGRCFVYQDFLPRNAANGNSDSAAANSIDQSGHGTHVIATIADNNLVKLADDEKKSPTGVAPQVNLVIARALDANGAGTYSSVIAALDWIVQNKERYNIRIINLSLYATVNGPYWADPLNQAVMRAWQAGIVVVAAAGNDGPTAGTITVPGNVPYVITVGAVKSGRYTDSSYDELATYSSRGPTESAFVKPDVVVPASRTIAPMPSQSTLATKLQELRAANEAKCSVDGKMVKPANAITSATPAYCYESRKKVDFQLGTANKDHAYYQLSGTSMAAAEVSGVVALMLQANPGLTNDEVKYRLLVTARPATEAATGKSVYTPWEQGAGLIDTDQAIFTTTVGFANAGMDLALDLDTSSEQQVHPWGNTVWDEASGEFRLVDPVSGEYVAVWNGGNVIWGGGNIIWGGGNVIWGGGSNVIWGGGSNVIWGGGNIIWGGANRIWGGGNVIWGGGNIIWGGGNIIWGGSQALWAGSNRIWGGTTTTNPNNASRVETLFTDQ